MLGPISHILAGVPGSGGGGGGAVVSTLFWVGLLIIFVVAGGAMVMVYRRRLFREEEDRISADRGLMESLREAVRKGEMTPEEFEATKRVMAARFRGYPSPRQAGRPENPSVSSAKSSTSRPADASRSNKIE